jgi:hypothetical protein
MDLMETDREERSLKEVAQNCVKRQVLALTLFEPIRTVSNGRSWH